MNAMAQICGLALLIVLMWFYASHRKVGLHTTKGYVFMWSMSFINLIVDIISVFMLINAHKIPVWLLHTVCKIYLVTVLAFVTAGLVYVCLDIYAEHRNYIPKLRIIAIAAVLEMILVFCLPIYNVKTMAGEVYTYGPSVLVTYIITFIYIISNLILIFRQRHNMNADRGRAVVVWLCLWLFSAVIQFIHNEWLIVGFFGALGIMVIYLKLENPDAFYDRKMGIFTQATFLEYTKQLFHEGKEFAVICMKFPEDLYYGQEKESQTIQVEITNYLNGISDALVFVNGFDEIALVVKNDRKAESICKQVMERFSAPWGSKKEYMLSPNWVYLPQTSVIHQSEDLLYIIRYFLDAEEKLEPGKLLVINQERVAKVYEEQNIEKLIVEALEEDRVEVFYQPIYSTEQKKITSAEALVRIRDKEGKIIPPGVFIEIAEKKGLILQLGEKVFEKVCCFIQQEKPKDYGIEYIEVNLSVVQCAYKKLAEKFIACMEKYHVDPAYINLEITETASLTAKHTLLRNMEILREYGISFSLDDFGTGESNLNYIIEMPVDIVKFDRGMTNAYFENGKAKYVMDAAIQMIHGLQLKIVSEGVETREQLQTLEGLNINYIQGYYFSKPLPRNEFLQYMQAL